VILPLLLVAAAVRVPQVNVSREGSAQDEPTIAASPRDPAVLLAASNDATYGVEAFTSTNDGVSWALSYPATDQGANCAEGDPRAVIADDGRELVSYLAAPCDAPADARSSIYVSTRGGPADPWQPTLVAGTADADNDHPKASWDDVAASPYHGRAYLVWDRFTATADELVASHSDDGGRSWSAPAFVRGTRTRDGTATADDLEVGPDGTVYLAWEDTNNVAWLARSTNGGETFESARVAASGLPFSRTCENNETGGVTAIPAQARRCVDVNVTVAVLAHRVTAVYTTWRRGSRDLAVYARTFDPALRRRSKAVRIRPVRGRARSDQFMPAAAADRDGRRAWACWYDTRGDPTRRSALFTCSSSRTGLRWAPAQAVASVRSDESGPSADELQYGDYESLAVGVDGAAHPIWTDSRDLATLGEEIYTTTVPPPAPAQAFR
jgi:hypothetical protein